MEKEKKENSINFKFILLILIIFIILCLLWARFISTKGLVVKEYAITDNNLNEAYNGLKIVQFSDLHYGSTIGIKELENVVNRINDQNADIVVFSGDLIDPRAKLSDEDITNIIEILNKIEAKLEIIAVIGNHDYDTEYWKSITPYLNWKILTNEALFIYNDSKVPIVFVAFDDYLNGNSNYEEAFNFQEENDYYTIVLLHEPDQIDEISDYKFDLVLAGHSHLGQVRLPFVGAIYTQVGAKKYYDEHYIINDVNLYINGGIGTSALDVRFFNKPSISLYRFYTN